MIKDILKYFFSRYGYILWVSFCLGLMGTSMSIIFLVIFPLELLIAWRDSQFIDEDGYNMIFSLERKIFNKLKFYYERCTNIR